MVSTRLEIGTEDNVGVFENIPIDIVFQINDVRDPANRKGTMSKTIKLPSSQEVNLLFENIFEVNLSLQTFNPNLKTTATYYVDELVNFDGYIQLLKINLNEVTGQVTYECSLIGELKTLFTDIANDYLTDLDFSAYDHNLTYANITNAWSSTVGVQYPIIDYGVNNSNLSFMKPEHFRGALYVKKYLELIFAAYGYTWTSTFLDSDFFSRLIIPAVDFPTLTDAQVNANKFLANVNTAQTITVAPTYTVGQLAYSSSTNTDINFPTVTYNVGGQYSDPTWTPTVTNKYNIQTSLSVNFVVKNNGVAVTGVTGQVGNINVFLLANNSVIGAYTLPMTLVSFAASNSAGCNINFNNFTLTSGVAYKVAVQISNPTLNVPAAVPVGTGYTLETTVTAGTFSAEFSSNSVYEGINVQANTLIPTNIKQTDLVKSIFRMFNLQAINDKTNPKNYIIEQAPTFYKDFTFAKDWSLKHDKGSETEIIPLGELNNIKYVYKYKEDGDFLNKLYQDEYAEAYGTHTEEIVNDFIKGEKVTDVIFSPSPYIKNPYFNLVCPAILKRENNVIAPHKGNLRILYWSGAIALPNTQWTFSYNNGSSFTTYTTYPHAGHTNTPYAPTLDINWGLPKKVYYTFPNQQWTTRNLYNEYYSKQVNQETDKNSKIVITDFYLTPTDIAQLDFRYPVYFELNGAQSYYRINKVSYNPLVSKTSRVELLKLADYDDFVEGTYEFNGGLGGVENQSYNRTVNQNETTGTDNINYGESSKILGGSGNFVALGAEDIQLTNCENVTVLGDVVGFIGIGLSNLTIDSSFNNSIVTAPSPSITITSDTTFTSLYNGKTVYIDATSNDITLTWDSINMNDVTINFIRADNSIYNVYITDVGGYGTETFIGNALPYNLGLIQYDAIPLTSKLDTIYLNY